jgi:hypothetical protein
MLNHKKAVCQKQYNTITNGISFDIPLLPEIYTLQWFSLRLSQGSNFLFITDPGFIQESYDNLSKYH